MFYLWQMDRAPINDATPDAFRAAMRGFVGACSLITVGQGEEASGLVVTTGISLTADPPMVLACINRASSCWPLLGRCGVFGWSALGAGHQAVAERFSGKGGAKGAARYDGADWVEAETGARLLADAPLAFDCRVDEMIDRGTHSILIGRVLHIRTMADGGALLYWNGQYRPLAD
ncbi:MAG: flavin reductase family protein [Cypionkella sp.]